MGIQACNISKRFGDFVALDDISIDVRSGRLTALLGPSGGGKSTLLRVIAGLDQADSGTVRIEGADATGLPPQRRDVGFVFQHYAAFKHLSVFRNVAFGLEVRKRPKAEVRKRVYELLELVHLDQFADRLPGPAVRRSAAADGAGPGARRRAEGAAAGRAVRRARRQGAQGTARLAAPAARRGPRDDRVRHPRPGGGARGLRRARGDQPRPGRAGRRPQRPLRPAGQRVRDGVPRPGHPAGRPAGTPARHRHLRPRPARHRPRHASTACSGWGSRSEPTWRPATPPCGSS